MNSVGLGEVVFSVVVIYSGYRYSMMIESMMQRDIIMPQRRQAG